MTEQAKQKSLIPVLRTLLILTVSALAFGTEAMAQPGDTDNPGAGVAAILDEDTVPEEASLKTAEQEVRVGEAALAVSVGRQQNKNTGKTQEEELELVMTNVSNTLNVRKEPDEEAEKIGYLYADCGGTILERKDGWTKLESGGLIGWAKDEYLLFDEEAVQEARQVGRTMATVTGDTLRIRKEPDPDAGVYALAARGESFEVVGESELEFSDGIHLSEDWAAHRLRRLHRLYLLRLHLRRLRSRQRRDPPGNSRPEKPHRQKQSPLPQKQPKAAVQKPTHRPVKPKKKMQA